jgi:hypothetical protein
MNTQVSFEKKGNKEKHFAIVVERNGKEELKEIGIIRIMGLRRREKLFLLFQFLSNKKSS